MSLLMEALRKAEEAKSKAAKKDAKPDAEHQGAAPADDPFADLAGHATDPVTEVTGDSERDGPVVINPDPDEEEILAAHAGDLTLAPVSDDSEDSDEEYEKVEFTTSGAAEDPDADTETADPTPADDFFSRDDGLSLLQSTYFSRTQNTGQNSLDDEFPDTDDDGEVQADDSDTVFSGMADPVAPAATDSTVSGRTKEPANDSAAAGNQASERAQRDSASALFLAKQDSSKRRLRKLVSVAAIVLLFPMAGIVYWLFTSLSDSSGMQFNVQGNASQANRSFSDFQATLPADTGDQAASPQDEPVTADTAVAEDDGMVELAGLPSPDAGNTTTEDTAVVANDTASTNEPAQANTPVPEQVANTAPAPAPEPPAQTPPPQPAPRTTAPAPEPIAAAPAQPTTQPTQTARAPEADNGLSFARTTPTQVINPDLSAAFDSYQAGDYAVAARLYQQVLNSEPNNRDALLHLASVFVKQDNAAMAQALYVKLLELNPRDPLARAGLLESVQGDPVRQETELKSLITAYPGTAQLSFALGNLYATQRRWSEAQGAYFDALLAAKANNTGPVSPDYAFNLAVSLERINQLGAALDYYREAKTQSAFATPGFDPAVLDQRLDALAARLRQ